MEERRPSSEEADWQEQEQGSQTTLLSSNDYNEKNSPLALPAHKPSTRKWRAQGFVLGLVLGLAITAFITTLLQSTRPYNSPTPSTPKPTHHPDYSLNPQGARPRISLPPSTIDSPTGKPSSWFNGPCGNTTTTAIAAKCHFSPISFSWLPPGCWTPADAVEEMAFLNLRDWKYYLHADMNSPNGTESEEVSLQALLDHGEHWGVKYVFTDWEWHLTHCVFMWRRMHRQLLSGGPVDGYLAQMEHTLHCGDKLLKVVPPGWEMRTRIWVKYPSCY